MDQFKVGQRFPIQGSPFPAFFEITESPGMFSGIEGDVVIVFPKHAISAEIDASNAEEVSITIKAPGRPQKRLSWHIDVDNIERLETHVVQYWNVRFEITK